MALRLGTDSRCQAGAEGEAVRRPGDWSLANPQLEPAGWFFEYRNSFYPDTDDTAMVLMALAKTGHALTPVARPAAWAGSPRPNAAWNAARNSRA